MIGRFTPGLEKPRLPSCYRSAMQQLHHPTGALPRPALLAKVVLTEDNQPPLTAGNLKGNKPMTPCLKKISLAALALATPCLLHAADVTGKWKSEFESQIGHLIYVYDLKADGEK